MGLSGEGASGGCPGGGCPRIGPDACWWPLVHTSTNKMLDEAFIMSGNVYITNQVAAHNGVEYPLPWWAEAYERKMPYIGSRRAACAGGARLRGAARVLDAGGAIAAAAPRC